MPHDFICLICPNGCHLRTITDADGAVEVNGNRCDKGLGFARRVLGGHQHKFAGRIVSKEDRPAYTREILKEVAGFWGISLKKVCPHFMPAGSPERTLFRVVIEDEDKGLFVLEEVRSSSYHAKMKIIRTLEFLSQKGMDKIAAYRADAQGQYLKEYGDGLWQCVPFYSGEVLDRTTYLYEAWRADVLSRFLISLKDGSAGLPFFALDEKFSIKKYVYTLCAQAQRRRPELMPQIGKILDFLERDFMPAHDRLPAGFCHGDYHPLNIIWGKDDIRAVIDWEFLGMKPELYDAANMVGCLGMEHPSSLEGDLVVNFIRQLKASDIFSSLSWDHFTGLVVALRFAWLSEWLRKDDEEMIALELDYMSLLMENAAFLREKWV